MQGIHDLGGRHGFGVLEVETDEPAFHHRWEAAVFAMMFAAGRAGVTLRLLRLTRTVRLDRFARPSSRSSSSSSFPAGGR